jgi:hypothetical protein
MANKSTVGAIVAAVAIGAAGTVGAQKVSRPEPLILNVQDAVLRDGVNVVETICAEIAGARGEITTQCFTDALPADEAAARRAVLQAKALERWKSHYFK